MYSSAEAAFAAYVDREVGNGRDHEAVFAEISQVVAPKIGAVKRWYIGASSTSGLNRITLEDEMHVRGFTASSVSKLDETIKRLRALLHATPSLKTNDNIQEILQQKNANSATAILKGGIGIRSAKRKYLEVYVASELTKLNEEQLERYRAYIEALDMSTAHIPSSKPKALQDHRSDRSKNIASDLAADRKRNREIAASDTEATEQEVEPEETFEEEGSATPSKDLATSNSSSSSGLDSAMLTLMASYIDWLRPLLDRILETGDIEAANELRERAGRNVFLEVSTDLNIIGDPREFRAHIERNA